MKARTSFLALVTVIAASVIGSAVEAASCSSCNAGTAVSVNPIYSSYGVAPAAYCGACMPVTTCQTYKPVCQTVYDTEQVTAYRLEYDTVYDKQNVTTYKPVWETQYRERRYTVAKPVTETSFREDRYTVSKPVWETSERSESYVVCRPVTKTIIQDRYCTQYRPETTYTTRYVDQGCMSSQTVYQPQRPRNRLRWVQRKEIYDPLTGAVVRQRAGLYWVPQPRGQYVTQRTWVPNVVAQQIPVTTYRPQTVVQKIPVNVTEYVRETHVRKVPVQTCRWVQEQVVRKVPVQTCRMTYEEKVEQCPVKVQKWVAETCVVQKPRTVCRRVPYTYTRQTPRTVVSYLPLDACGNVITTPAPVTGPAPVQNKPTLAPAEQDQQGEQSVLGNGATNEDAKPVEKPALEKAPADTGANDWTNSNDSAKEEVPWPTPAPLNNNPLDTKSLKPLTPEPKKTPELPELTPATKA